MSDSPGKHLSRIKTSWSLLRRAQAAPSDDAEVARRLLVEKYGGAVRRYLTVVLGDADAAEDLAQDFAVDLVTGGFRGADPGKGRFRDYVKSALFHRVIRYREQVRKRPRSLSGNSPILEAASARVQNSSEAFEQGWRGHLLDRAWSALSETHPSSHVVLRYRADHPKARSEQMVEPLGALLNRAITAAGVRQAIHRARERFAALLFDQVWNSLADPSEDEVEAELAELGLLEYCRDYLRRLRKTDA